MKAAVIDLGTNTFNLLIAEKKNGKYSEIYRDKRSVKLGKGGLARNMIAQDAYQRAIDAVKDYYSIIQNHKVEKIKVVATSGFRTTENGHQLANEIEAIVNFPVEIIDGNKEAEFIYYGIRAAVPLNSQYVLMMDIGGGSNELIIGNNQQIAWKKSYKLGISRLIELFKPNDPLTPDDIKKIVEHIKLETNDLPEVLKEYPVQTLVGSSGSFDLLANMLHFKEYQKPLDTTKTYNILNLFQTIRLLDMLIISSYEQRKDMPGMDMTRIEMIPIAALFIRTIMEYFSCKQVIHSSYAIKEGVWIRTFLK